MKLSKFIFLTITFKVHLISALSDNLNNGQVVLENPSKEEIVYKEDDEYDHIFNSAKIKDGKIRYNDISPIGLESPEVNQISGYIDLDNDNKHLFFWFFESRNNHKKNKNSDPTVMWLNGGPGCSSSIGLLTELGPSTVSKKGKNNLIRNPFSWNNDANLLFLDQPVNVGYSYSNNRVVLSTDAAAKDVYDFLLIFFEAFPQYAENGFHIAGESYGGHYVPAIGNQIVSHPYEERNFNLSSILVGNGITDALIQYDYYHPMACGGVSISGYPAVLSEEECDKMASRIPLCGKLLNLCYKTKNIPACIASSTYCESVVGIPYEKTGYNVYDIRANCTADPDACDTGDEFAEEFLSSPYVRKIAGAETKGNFSACDDSVFFSFGLTGDLSKPFQQHVAYLLNNNIPVLIYAGDADYICNWLGNRAWTDQLKWNNSVQYSLENEIPWYVDGKQAGVKKSYKELTFLRIFQAGHLVPFYQPKNSFIMLKEWIKGKHGL